MSWVGSFPPPPTAVDNAQQDATMALAMCKDLELRLQRLEYIIRKIEEAHPDIAKTSCAECKYLYYGKTVGRGATDEPVMLCRKRRDTLDRVWSVDGSGCYKWERRKR